jgi:hypothetical protein
LIVAANGPKGLAVTAEHGQGWVTFPGTAGPEQFAQDTAARVATLDRILDERGRDPRQLRRILLAYGAMSPWSSVDGFADLVEQYAQLGIDEIVCYAPQPGEQAVFDAVASRLDEFR